MSRALRRHHRNRVKANRMRDWLGFYGSTPENAPRDMATRHPMDCGNPRCGLCHSEKLQSRSPERRAWRREAEAG